MNVINTHLAMHDTVSLSLYKTNEIITRCQDILIYRY